MEKRGIQLWTLEENLEAINGIYIIMHLERKKPSNISGRIRKHNSNMARDHRKYPGDHIGKKMDRGWLEDNKNIRPYPSQVEFKTTNARKQIMEI